MLAGDVQETGADLACPKCRMFGCDCTAPVPSGRNAMASTCMVCRRHKALCICRSHLSVPVLPDDHEPSGRAVRVLSKKEIDMRVNEAVSMYYDRDPKALAALVRGWFQ